MYEIKLWLIILLPGLFTHLLKMPRKYVWITVNTRGTRVYSKQPSGQYNNWPVQFSPQRNIVNTQIISVPVSCLSIFKFHRHSLDSPIYKNFTIFAVPKKKKKKKHQKCHIHLAPEIGIPIGHQFILYTTIDIKKLIQLGQIILDLSPA